MLYHDVSKDIMRGIWGSSIGALKTRTVMTGTTSLVWIRPPVHSLFGRVTGFRVLISASPSRVLREATNASNVGALVTLIMAWILRTSRESTLTS